ncbi:MAG TPA: TraB/GumN family protein [Micropepsaceae bacterium]|nr:TraB/GumN family protein [Micropepsaceae bacterium]
MRKFALLPIGLAWALFVQMAATVAATPAMASGPAIWRIRSADSTVYLFGSIHILPHGYPWMTRRIADAMDASDLFVFEIPIDNDTRAEEREFTAKYGVLRERQSIRGVLTQGEFDRYAAVMQAAGLSARDYERYRPWLASLMLGLAYLHPDDLTALRGADDEVMTFAREHKRQSEYLESVQQQLELLTSGSEASHIAELRHLIDTLPSSRDTESELLAAWSSGNIDRLSAELAGIFNPSPETEKFLLSQRNHLWLSTIRPLLQRPGTTMITVGAAHIAGSDGLIALICGEGYRVERLLDSRADSDACPAIAASP